MDEIYQDLVTERKAILQDLRAAEAEPARLYKEKSMLADMIKDMESEIIMAIPGRYVGLGKNEAERGYMLRGILAESGELQNMIKAQANAEEQYRNASMQVDNLRSALASNGNAMRLHAAYLLSTRTVALDLPTEPALAVAGDDFEL